MTYKVITKESKKLRLRLSPALESPVVGYVYKDKTYPFDSTDTSGCWAHTYEGEDGASGWASLDYLQLVQEQTVTSATPAQNNNDILMQFSREDLQKVIVYLDSLLKGC